MDIFYQIVDVIALFVQILGLILFGVVAGWFTLNITNQPEKSWQLLSIVYSVFLVFVALMVRYLTPGALGAFLVGAAGAMFYWGLFKNREKPAKKK
jgi:Kef-type K+ transport system membrane component KefB